MSTTLLIGGQINSFMTLGDQKGPLAPAMSSVSAMTSTPRSSMLAAILIWTSATMFTTFSVKRRFM
jgi:hypothetical protein